MHAHRLWVTLAITWLFCSGGRGDKGIEVQCDDKSVEDIVDLGLFAYNKDLKDGSQLALYQINGASKAKNESGTSVAVDFTARETECAAGEIKNWKECNYLQDASKVLRHCHVKALLTDTIQIIFHLCSVDPEVKPEQRPHCLGCPEKIDVESVDLMESLTYSVLTANVINDHTHHFLLNTIAEATRQVIAGFRYKLRFDMQKSNCSKADFKELSEDCHLDNDDKVQINCNSTVDVAPWRHELPETSVSCEPGALPTRFSIRRRPPGWSPLRNVHNFHVKKPAKKESSEESHENRQTTVPLTEGTDTALTTAHNSTIQVPVTNDATSLRCPSKPWKEFKVPPARPPPPPPRPDEVPSLDLFDALDD